MSTNILFLKSSSKINFLNIIFLGEKQKAEFASSTVPRTNRSNPDIKFRIGQVIKHKLWGYKAVIVGWDQQTNAPEEWIEQVGEFLKIGIHRKLLAYQTLS